MKAEMASLALRLNGLRCDGNQLFAQRNYEEAIDIYTECISECLEAMVEAPPGHGHGQGQDLEREGGGGGLEQQQLHQDSNGGAAAPGPCPAPGPTAAIRKTLLLAYSNRAESHLRVSNYEGALADAESALELEADNVKSLNRRGKALEGLQQYEMAARSFAAAHKQAPHDHDIERAMRRNKICVQQVTAGEYNLSEFYANGCKGSIHPCCDYVGPVLISKVRNAGRGLILTRDVTAGELLLVSNALAMAFVLPEPSLLHQGLHYECENEDEHLISKLALVASRSPKARHQLYSLAHQNSQLDMEIPSMDLFRPGREWMQSSCIQAKSGSADDVVDIIRIWGVARYSALNLYGYTADISEYYDSERARRRGLWPLASFMNHSCHPNCLRMHIGNAMFVRAARHIPAGDELTINYFGVLDSVKTRQESAKEWGFQCSCSRCEFEQGIAPLERLQKKFHQLIRARPAWPEDEDNGGARPQVSQDDLTSLFNGAEDIIKSRASLDPEQKHWIMASCIYAYVAQAATVKNNPKRRVYFLSALVESITAVSASNVWGLEYACDLLQEVGRLHGRCSEEYVKTERRVMDVFRTAYGAESTKKALESLILLFHESVGSVHSCDRC